MFAVPKTQLSFLDRLKGVWVWEYLLILTLHYNKSIHRKKNLFTKSFKAIRKGLLEL